MTFRSIPSLSANKPRPDDIDEKGRKIPNKVPHPEIMSHGRLPTLQEQLLRFSRLNEVRKQQFWDDLFPEDDDLIDFHDDFSEGMTQYEMQDWLDQKAKIEKVRGGKRSQKAGEDDTDKALEEPKKEA